MKYSTLNEIIALAQTFYNQQLGTKYHTWKHAQEVIDAVEYLVDAESMHSCRNKLLIAAAWHDAVYVPGATNGANEECSAAALLFATRYIKDEDDIAVIKQAADLIRRTTIADHMTCGYSMELSILLDADLSSLAAQQIEFLNNQENIIEENGGTKTPNGNYDFTKTYEFLNNLRSTRLDNCFYRTSAAQEKWSEKANKNICMLIDWGTEW